MWAHCEQHLELITRRAEGNRHAEQERWADARTGRTCVATHGAQEIWMHYTRDTGALNNSELYERGLRRAVNDPYT